MTKFVTAPVGSMRDTDGGLARCAIHLWPWLSMVMPSPALAVSGYWLSSVPLASNSWMLVPPEIQAWPLRSKAMANGLPEAELIGVIDEVTGSTMSNVP